MSTSEHINHPAHYNAGKVEVIEFIEDQMFGYHRGNAVKYLCRAGKKDPSKEVEDLRKAKWYIEREVELLTKTAPRRPNEMNEKPGIMDDDAKFGWMEPKEERDAKK